MGGSGKERNFLETPDHPPRMGGIEERLRGNKREEGKNPKKAWKRKLGDLITRLTNPVSVGIGLATTAYCFYTYQQGLPWPSATQGSVGTGALSWLSARTTLDWFAHELLVERSELPTQIDPRKPHETLFAKRMKYLGITYGYILPGITMGYGYASEIFAYLAEGIGYLLNPELPRERFFGANLIGETAMAYTALITGMGLANFIRYTALQRGIRGTARGLAVSFFAMMGKRRIAHKLAERFAQEEKDKKRGEASGDYDLALQRLRVGETSGFLLQIKEVLEKIITRDAGQGYDPFLSMFIMGSIRKQERKRKTTRRDILENFYLRFMYRHFAHAEEVIDQCIHSSPQDYEIQLLSALYVEARKQQSEENLTEEKKRTAIQGILHQGEQRTAFHQQGEHRNEVLFYKPEQSVFLAGTLVYKRNQDPTGLQTEETNLRFLRTRLGNRVVRVLDAFVDTGLHYLALLYAGKKTLTDDAPKNGQQTKPDQYVERLRLCLDLLVDIQYTMETQTDTIPLDPIGERDGHYFAKRVRDVFFGQLKQHGIAVDSQGEEVVLNAHEAINDELRALSRDQLAFYTDANPGNWFVDEQGRITRGDLESNRLLPQYFDLLLLFDFLGETLKEDERRQLEMHYIQRRAQRFGTAVDLRAFERTKRIAGYHKHLEQAGYKARDAALSKKAGRDPQQHHKVAHYHLKRAGHYLDQMIAYSDVPQKHHGLLRDTRFALAQMGAGLQ